MITRYHESGFSNKGTCVDLRLCTIHPLQLTLSDWNQPESETVNHDRVSTTLSSNRTDNQETIDLYLSLEKHCMWGLWIHWTTVTRSKDSGTTPEE